MNCIDVFKTDETHFSFIKKNSLTLFPVLVKTSKYGKISVQINFKMIACFLIKIFSTLKKKKSTPVRSILKG